MTPMNPITLSFPDEYERGFREDYFNKSLRPVRFAVLSGAFLFGIFGYLDGKLVPEARNEIWMIRYAVVCPFLLAFYFFTYSPLFKKYMQAWVCLPILIPGFGLIAMMIIAPAFGTYYYSGLMLVIMYSYTFIRLRFVYATFCSLTITFAYHALALWVNREPFVVVLNNDFALFAANYIGMFVAYLLEQHFRRDYLHDILLEIERDKSNHLLLNILPAPIAERLKLGENPIVDSFPEATVLFADIAGFTRISSSYSPERLVALMNEVFSMLDRIVEKHQLEKIKTIGDAYMLVAGVPLPRPDHAEAVADAALEMQEGLNQLQAGREGWLRMRIGIHTGPLVAGVIGTKKFIYDLWGDTVNVASRMESNGVAGCNQVTQDTYERLRHKFIFMERGVLEIKGKGEMQAYLLIGRKTEDTEEQ